LTARFRAGAVGNLSIRVVGRAISDRISRSKSSVCGVAGPTRIANSGPEILAARAVEESSLNRKEVVALPASADRSSDRPAGSAVLPADCTNSLIRQRVRKPGCRKDQLQTATGTP